MQWNSNKHSGFTSGIPWLNVNRRYEEINVETDLSNAKSIYKLYQLLIKFKKDNYDLISQKILDISFVDDLIIYNKPGFKFIGNMSCNTHDYNYDHFDLSNYENVELGILLPFQFVIIRKDSN
jgi:glycosidase